VKPYGQSKKGSLGNSHRNNRSFDFPDSVLQIDPQEIDQKRKFRKSLQSLQEKSKVVVRFKEGKKVTKGVDNLTKME
jgi:hypothetical protein